MIAIPDFIIATFPRSGTNLLHELLDSTKLVGSDEVISLIRPLWCRAA